MIHFLGTSHAAQHLKAAAIARGASVTDEMNDADVIFVSEDTPTDSQGNRNLAPIRDLVMEASKTGAQIVLTSQVPPGFTRALGLVNIYHQAETLRIFDAAERAFSPEYIAVGGPAGIHREYAEYLMSFKCPILRMNWEEAEMTKIAVNMMLAAQVDMTNKLASVAGKFGANWEKVAEAMKYDKRIGSHAYLRLGNWKDSPHLLRDHITLEELCTR